MTTKTSTKYLPAWSTRNDEKGNEKAENSHASPGISSIPALLTPCAALAPRLKDTVEVEKVHRPHSSKVLYNLYTGRDGASF